MSTNRPESSTIASLPGAPSCPRCGSAMIRFSDQPRLVMQRVTCTTCGYSWAPDSRAQGLFHPRQILTRECAYCRSAMLPSSRYCVTCGRAQPGVAEQFQAVARRTHIPAETLEEQAWHEDTMLAALWQNIFWLESRENVMTARIGGLVAAGSPVSAPETVPPPAEPLSEPAEPELAAPEAEPEPDYRIPEIETLPAFDEPVLPRAAATASPDVAASARRPGAPAVPPAPAAPPAKHRELDLEQLISGRGMALAGGLAVLLGAVFFLSLAFSRGWIGPELRVGMGVATASAMILLGGRFFGRNEAVVGHVLTAVGLGVMSLSMFAGTRLYDLFPVELGLTGSLVAAAVTAFIAIRNNLQLVAGYGLVAALAAPPVLGASVNGVTIALLATTLIGTTAIALSRSWVWLPPAAFILAAPQIADWVIDRPAVVPGLAALAGFWILNALSAGGEAFRSRASRLQPTSATLLIANAAFTVWGGYMVLDDRFDAWGGTFLLAVALAHGALGGWFLRDRGAFHPFGMLAFGTGVAALTMAVPVQFGGPIVPIAYAAEAAALAWVAGRLRHEYAGLTAVALGGLSIAHVLMFEYPFASLTNPELPDRVLLNASALTVAFQLVALAAAGYFARSATVRQVLAAIGFALTAYAMPFELSGNWLIAAWSALAASGFLLLAQPGWQRPDGLEELPGRALLTATSSAVWLLTVGHLLAFEYPFDQLRVDAEQSPPFINGNGLALLIVLAGIAVTGLVRKGMYRLPAAIAGFGLVLWAMPFELSGVELVAGWSAVALLAIAAGRLPGFSTFPHTWGLAEDDRATLGQLGVMLPAFGGWLLGLSHLLAVELQNATIGGGEGTPFTDTLTVASGLLIGVAAIGAYVTRERPWTTGWALGALAVTATLIPYQVGSAATVAAWSLLAAVTVFFAERARHHAQVFISAATFLVLAAVAVTFGDVAPFERLVVDALSTVDHPILWSGATGALGSLAAVLVWTARRLPEIRYRRWMLVAAGALMVYLLSVGVVDHFQRQVGEVGLESLQKRAQVGLSILWAALGGLSFAAGVMRRHREERLFGLGLLGIATIKVFVYDLSSLDASYRVLSLIGLGLLLLASSYLYLRFIGPLNREEEAAESRDHSADTGDHAPTSVTP